MLKVLKGGGGGQMPRGKGLRFGYFGDSRVQNGAPEGKRSFEAGPRGRGRASQPPPCPPLSVPILRLAGGCHQGRGEGVCAQAGGLERPGAGAPAAPSPSAARGRCLLSCVEGGQCQKCSSEGGCGAWGAHLGRSSWLDGREWGRRSEVYSGTLPLVGGVHG